MEKIPFKIFIPIPLKDAHHLYIYNLFYLLKNYITAVR